MIASKENNKNLPSDTLDVFTPKTMLGRAPAISEAFTMEAPAVSEAFTIVAPFLSGFINHHFCNRTFTVYSGHGVIDVWDDLA